MTESTKIIRSSDMENEKLYTYEFVKGKSCNE